MYTDEQIFALKSLSQYQLSKLVLEVIQSKLPKDGKSAEYLATKLKLSQNDYTQHLLNILKGEEDKNELIYQDILNRANDEQFKPIDSFTTPGGRSFFKTNFIPKNTVDVSQYQSNREVISYDKYREMKNIEDEKVD